MPFLRSRRASILGDDEDKAKKIKALEKILRWITVCGAMLTLSFLSYFSIMLTLFGILPFDYWMSQLFCFAISRIAISFSQVRANLALGTVAPLLDFVNPGYCIPKFALT